jgi:hypothetical protein
MTESREGEAEDFVSGDLGVEAGEGLLRPEIEHLLGQARIGEMISETVRLQAQLRTAEQQRVELERVVGEQRARIEDLDGQLAAAAEQRPKIGIETLADQLRSAVQAANARVASVPGSTSFAIDTLEAELRAPLDLADGIALRQAAPGTSTEPSTIRIVLRPTTSIKLIDEEE